MNKLIPLLTAFLLLLPISTNASQVLTEAVFHALDANGDPLSSGYISTYECGTTTAKETYSDAALTNALAADIPIGSDGRTATQIFFSGCMRYRIYASDDTLLDDQDNVYGRGSTVPGVELAGYSGIEAACTALNAAGTDVTLYLNGTDTMAGNQTCNANISIIGTEGGIITTTGYTLTINGPFSTQGNVKVFNGSGLVTFGEGTTPRINIAWWGLNGDGDITNGSGTDDSAAFDAAIASVKSTNSAIYGFHGTGTDQEVRFVPLYLPAGVYLCTDGLFLGRDYDPGSEGYGDKVDYFYGEPGATILGKHTEPVLDYTGAHRCKIKDITVIGADGASVPTVGILFACPEDLSGGRHELTGVRVMGNFSVSAVYNYGSEINRWYGGYIQNAEGSAAYICTEDNSNLNVSSPNTTIATGAESMFGPIFFGTNFDFRPDTGHSGIAVVLLESVTHPRFYGCFFNQGATDDLSYIQFREASGASSTQVVIEGCEFHSVYPVGIDIRQRIRKISVRDNRWGSGGTTCVDLNDGGAGGIILDDAHIEAPIIDGDTNITGNARCISGCTLKVIDDPSLTSSLIWNDDIEGDVHIDSSDTLTISGTHTGRIIYTDIGEIRGYGRHGVAQYYFRDEFDWETDATNIASWNTTFWTRGGTNSADSDVTIETNVAGGIGQLVAAGAQNDSTWISGEGLFREASDIVFETEFAISSASDIYVAVGLVEGTYNAATEDDDILVVGFDSSTDTNWTLRTNNNNAGVETGDLGTAADTSYTKFRVDARDPTDIRAWLNDIEISLSAKDIQAATTLMPFIHIMTTEAGGATKNIKVKYFRIWQNE